MRVAMLGQYPLDEQRIFGGDEAVIVPLVRSLASFDDLELHVVTCQAGIEDQLGRTQSGVPLHIRRRRRLGRLTFYARDVSSIRRTLRDLSPDVVHAQGIGLYAIVATGSPYEHVVTTHGIVFREAGFARGLAARMRGSLDRLYERYSLARVENLIAISPYVQREVEHIGGFIGRLYLIENPVDDVFFSVGGHGEEATILYAGRVIPRKGLLNLLCALVHVRKALPHVHLRVAGETESVPAYVAACRQFITEHGLEKAVTLVGSLTTEQMALEYARCALLALPSKQETAPMAVAEAMAAGRPVVATRVCGMPYMVEDGASGFLVGEEDTMGLADALLRILGDDQLRMRMGERGRQLAETHFRADVVAQQTRQVYLRLSNKG